MIKQVPVAHLRPGMHLHRLDARWTEHPFWRQSFRLDAEDVAKLVGSGIPYAWIDTGKGLDVAREEIEPDRYFVERPQDQPVPPIGGDDDTPDVDTVAAERVCSQATAALRTVFADIRLGRALDSSRCVAIVEDIVRHVIGDPAAMLLVARLKRHDDYSHMHSVAVCALMVALARQLGLDHAQMCEAGLAGLLHDVGKLTVPAAIIDKPGALTPREYAQVKTHVQRGHALLVEAGTRSRMVLDVCLHHHERMDGSGYPHGLDGKHLTVHAKMAAVCDVYDALTSRRPHRGRVEPGAALRQMASQTGQFDPMVLQTFVRTVGIYPVGSLVRLRSHQLAIVVAQDADDLLKPRVKAFFSVVEGRPIESTYLTLAGGSDGIVNLETPESLGPEVMRWAGSAGHALRAA